jgi:hypothetical protein
MEVKTSTAEGRDSRFQFDVAAHETIFAHSAAEYEEPSGETCVVVQDRELLLLLSLAPTSADPAPGNMTMALTGLALEASHVFSSSPPRKPFRLSTAVAELLAALAAIEAMKQQQRQGAERESGEQGDGTEGEREEQGEDNEGGSEEKGAGTSNAGQGEEPPAPPGLGISGAAFGAQAIERTMVSHRAMVSYCDDPFAEGRTGTAHQGCVSVGPRPQPGQIFCVDMIQRRNALPGCAARTCSTPGHTPIVAKQGRRHKLLEEEEKLYQELKALQGSVLPKLLGVHGDTGALIFEDVGRSLDSELLSEFLELGFASQLKDQLTSHVAALHSRGYAHHDIRLDNVCVRLSMKSELKSRSAASPPVSVEFASPSSFLSSPSLQSRTAWRMSMLLHVRLIDLSHAGKLNEVAIQLGRTEDDIKKGELRKCKALIDDALEKVCAVRAQEGRSPPPSHPSRCVTGAGAGATDLC